MPYMASIGSVAIWFADDGWGVIESPDTPGGCWTHYATVDTAGYRSLPLGATVEFEWEQPGQDGYPYRAVHVRPATSPPADSAGTEPVTRTYRSSLHITRDDCP